MLETIAFDNAELVSSGQTRSVLRFYRALSRPRMRPTALVSVTSGERRSESCRADGEGLEVSLGDGEGEWRESGAKTREKKSPFSVGAGPPPRVGIANVNPSYSLKTCAERQEAALPLPAMLVGQEVAPSSLGMADTRQPEVTRAKGSTEARGSLEGAGNV